jgi:Zn finger protein HypA/HybF involved in hydrogenase expression
VPTHLPAAPDADQEPEYRCSCCSRLLFADELERFACRICEQRARDHLTALPGLYDQLADLLAPGSKNGGDGRVSIGRSAPIPVSLHVLDMRGPGGIVAELVAIEEAWRASLRWTATPFRGNYEQTLLGTTKFLAANVTWACSDYAEVAFDLDVIRQLRSKAESAVTGNRRRRVMVTCLARYDDGTQCGADLRIDISATVTRCRECGAEWGREDWVRLHDGLQSAA